LVNENATYNLPYFFYQVVSQFGLESISTADMAGLVAGPWREERVGGCKIQVFICIHFRKYGDTVALNFLIQ
jgi:hypothetical protein